MRLKTELYPHQIRAVEKLLPIRVGALYMEMGTGKTRTALEMIYKRLEAGKVKHALWLCPCSVRENLKEDINKHAEGALAHIAVYGIESLSSSIRLFEKLLEYVKASPTMLVVDESNLVKNFKAYRTQRIIALSQFCKYRMILNGTPISRSEVDLFAQWYILDWRIFGYRSFWSFANAHIEYDPEIKGKIKRVLNAEYLTSKISPYTYQVSLADCFELPNKKCYEYTYSLSYEHRSHYMEVVNQFLAELDEQHPSTLYRMFTAAQDIISGLYVENINGHIHTSPMYSEPLDNPRIQRLLEVIEDIDGQVIIFAKFTHEIRAILQVLPDAIGFYGTLSHKERIRNLQAFKAGKARFLIANKSCAGYGLNLQFCHNVIFYSNDWDYATRIQAEDRIYRLGQEHKVEIYDIVAARTLDCKILRCLERKENLSDEIKGRLKQENNRKIYKSWIMGEVEDAENVHR